MSLTLNHRLKEKKKKKRVWTKRKDDEMNRMLCHLCFWFTMNAPMCEAWKTSECVDKKGVMVEEWKARRKEVEEKEVEKREKGKSGFGKSPFCFCLTACLPLPFSPAPTTPPHRNTCSHSPTAHHTTWRISAHHHMQTGPCVGAAENTWPLPTELWWRHSLFCN